MVTWKYINLEANAVINTVKPYGTCARVNVPKPWIGKKVKIVLLEESEKHDPITGDTKPQ